MSLYCESPIRVPFGRYRRDLPPQEFQTVSCGRCKPCLNYRKNATAGRLVAEALDAKDVYFVTLTYADAPPDFVYRDVQLMLKRLRLALALLPTPVQVRFASVGERGNLHGRVHWHLLLFFDRKINIKPPKKNRLWNYWEFGWTNLRRLHQWGDDAGPVPEGDWTKVQTVMDGVRYVAKYCVKGLDPADKDKSTRLRGSVRLGQALQVAAAERCAREGLPFHGKFTIPNFAVTRGPRTGQLYRLTMKGAVARTALAVYTEVWNELRPDKQYATTKFVERYERDREREVRLHRGDLAFYRETAFKARKREEVTAKLEQWERDNGFETEERKKAREQRERNDAEASRVKLEVSQARSDGHRRRVFEAAAAAYAAEKTALEKMVADDPALAEGIEYELIRIADRFDWQCRTEDFGTEHSRGEVLLFGTHAERAELSRADEAREQRDAEAAREKVEWADCRAARVAAEGEDAEREEREAAEFERTDRQRRKAYRDGRFLQVNGTIPYSAREAYKRRKSGGKK